MGVRQTQRQLKELVLTDRMSPDDFMVRQSDIYQQLLSESAYLSAGNFSKVHPQDLEMMFREYDARFFDGLCTKLLQEQGCPLSFRLSNRMTRSGGMTSRRDWRAPHPHAGERHYEITASSFLLFDNFQPGSREITVCGATCEDRLQALQRIMEHEIVHLIEMLVWDRSSCAAKRFQGIAARWFQHQQFSHSLITPREKAQTEYGIRAGMAVSFDFEGRTIKGIVNRINKRATVLVPDRKGEPYSDGRRYQKYYVPLQHLKRVG